MRLVAQTFLDEIGTSLGMVTGRVPPYPAPAPVLFEDPRPRSPAGTGIDHPSPVKLRSNPGQTPVSTRLPDENQAEKVRSVRLCVFSFIFCGFIHFITILILTLRFTFLFLWVYSFYIHFNINIEMHKTSS